MSYELPIRRRCSRRTPTVKNAKTPFVNDTEPPVCAVADRPWRDKAFLKNRKTSLLTPVSRDIRHLTQILARYRAPSPMRSIVELVITAGPLILLWLLMWATVHLGYWLCLLLAVPAARWLVPPSVIPHAWCRGPFVHRRSTHVAGRSALR